MKPSTVSDLWPMPEETSWPVWLASFAAGLVAGLLAAHGFRSVVQLVFPSNLLTDLAAGIVGIGVLQAVMCGVMWLLVGFQTDTAEVKDIGELL